MFGKVKNTASMNTNGIGLGLFICKKIVQEFNGNLIVQSEFGKGTRFMFSFDLEDLEEVALSELSISLESHNLRPNKAADDKRGTFNVHDSLAPGIVLNNGLRKELKTEH